MANDLTFVQAAAILNEINSQVTGKKTIAPVDTTSFVSMATTTLKAGYDPVLNAISQILNGTYFGGRAYNSKLDFLRVDSRKYGNHTRKINYIDKPFENEDRYALVDGQAVDHYKVNKPAVVQTNIYGSEVYRKSITIFQSQLDNAFSGPDELLAFFSNLMTAIDSQIEMTKDSTVRLIMANMIAAKKTSTPVDVIHLVTEYNDVTGLTLDSDTVKQPQYYQDFIQWAYGRIQTVSDMMEERSLKYHMNFTNADIPRFTPKANQKLIVLAGEDNQISSRVLANVYNDERMKMIKSQKIGFWQSIDAPDGINLDDANTLNAAGAVIATGAVTQANIFGMLFDDEAMGYTIVNNKVLITPINAAGDYYNMYWHFTMKHWNDLSENCVVFVLD